MSKVVKYICFGLLAIAITMPRGWCCLVPQGNTQHSSNSAPKSDSCPFCNHKESSDGDSGPKPFDTPHPFTGFCCCEKVHGGLFQKSKTFEDSPNSQNYLTNPITLPIQPSFSRLTQFNQTSYPICQKIHVLYCQWLC